MSRAALWGVCALTGIVALLALAALVMGLLAMWWAAGPARLVAVTEFAGPFTAAHRNATVRYALDGDAVTALFEELVAPCSHGEVIVGEVPLHYRPLATAQSSPFLVVDASATCAGRADVSPNGTIAVFKDAAGSAFDGSADCGWRAQSLRWLVV